LISTRPHPRPIPRGCGEGWGGCRDGWGGLLAQGANWDVHMMKNAEKTKGKRLYGILNAMRHRVSNGNAEALNSKIRLLRIKARGYRNREHFKLGVMFHYGKLNMAF
ncbi:transposase, partial [Escherichia coli]